MKLRGISQSEAIFVAHPKETISETRPRLSLHAPLPLRMPHVPAHLLVKLFHTKTQKFAILIVFFCLYFTIASSYFSYTELML